MDRRLPPGTARQRFRPDLWVARRRWSDMPHHPVVIQRDDHRRGVQGGRGPCRAFNQGHRHLRGAEGAHFLSSECQVNTPPRGKAKQQDYKDA